MEWGDEAECVSAGLSLWAAEAPSHGVPPRHCVQCVSDWSHGMGRKVGIFPYLW